MDTLLLLLLTSSSAIAEGPRCRVAQLWPKVEDNILQTTFNHYDVIRLQSYRIRWNKAK